MRSFSFTTQVTITRAGKDEFERDLVGIQFLVPVETILEANRSKEAIASEIGKALIAEGYSPGDGERGNGPEIITTAFEKDGVELILYHYDHEIGVCVVLEDCGIDDRITEYPESTPLDKILAEVPKWYRLAKLRMVEFEEGGES